MTKLEACLATLAAAHGQSQNWQAANAVAERAIDEYMAAAGPTVAARRTALDVLVAEWDRRHPDRANDPALILSYLSKVDRDLANESGG
jgi:hypothetical protein